MCAPATKAVGEHVYDGKNVGENGVGIVVCGVGMRRGVRVDVWSACCGVIFANTGRNVQNDRSKVNG